MGMKKGGRNSKKQKEIIRGKQRTVLGHFKIRLLHEKKNGILKKWNIHLWKNIIVLKRSAYL